MQILNCIIVEDEPLAAEIIAEYVEQTPFLNLVKICDNALDAREVLRTTTIDAMFLDINMPKLTGLEFLRTLNRPPKVIITSAYHEYGIDGFDLQVVDYLLKPIELERFNLAVQKLLLPVHLAPSVPATGIKTEGHNVRPYYFFTVNKRSVKIYLDEILYFESLKDSVTIYTTNDRRYNTHYQLGELESILHDKSFLRIHRSFLVSMDKIDSFSAAEVEIEGRSLPIGRSHKELVSEVLALRTT
jgi:DNA-binding LytR/AlgR family response regulator